MSKYFIYMPNYFIYMPNYFIFICRSTFFSYVEVFYLYAQPLYFYMSKYFLFICRSTSFTYVEVICCHAECFIRKLRDDRLPLNTGFILRHIVSPFACSSTVDFSFSCSVTGYTVGELVMRVVLDHGKRHDGVYFVGSFNS